MFRVASERVQRNTVRVVTMSRSFVRVQARHYFTSGSKRPKVHLDRRMTRRVPRLRCVKLPDDPIHYSQATAERKDRESTITPS